MKCEIKLPEIPSWFNPNQPCWFENLTKISLYDNDKHKLLDVNLPDGDAMETELVRFEPVGSCSTVPGDYWHVGLELNSKKIALDWLVARAKNGRRFDFDESEASLSTEFKKIAAFAKRFAKAILDLYVSTHSSYTCPAAKVTSLKLSIMC